ncbi:uncharacterized protein [Oscarella lobularis]|uniref:uncharacterized protein isoform X2 n=2 Tax=Oscarella lobularis TaxID=121494 RepID=UPI0033138D2A
MSDQDLVEKALEDLKARVDQDTFFQTSFVLLKILQNIVLSPDDDKYRRIRRASKLLTQRGAAEALKAIGFREDDDYFVFDGTENVARRMRDRIGAFRRRHDEIGAWEIPTSALAFNERVGKGKYGEVYKGSWDGVVVAIKTLRPKCDDYAVDQFKKEAGIMRKCKHTNVLSMLAVCLYVEPSYIVLELMKSCYLEVLREETLTTKEILDGMTQVAAGVEYLHHIGIIHCDLAARNILVDFIGVCKISDFGLARMDGSSECNAVGSPGAFPTRWTAPEVFTSGTLSKKSDVWSFGIMFYEFTTCGAVPYAEFTNKETKAKVLEGYRLPQPPDCPDQFYAIQRKCWTAKPDMRPSLKEISESLLKFKVEMAQTRKASIGVRSTDSDESSPSPQPESLSVAAFPPPENLTPTTMRRSSSGLTKKGKLRRATASGIKVEKLLCVYTVVVFPFHSQVIVPIKRKHKASDVVSIVLKKVNKEKTDPSLFALVEVFDPEDDGERQMRYLKDKEQPLVVRSKWTKKGRYFMFNRVGGSEKLLEALSSYLNQEDNAAKMLYKTRGYLIKFDEKVGGMQGRNVSRNWIRYWTVLDGSSMLFYRDEEDEEEDEEPLFHLSMKGGQVEPASDYVKKRGVMRVLTSSSDQYLFHASTKEDMCRWIEAIYSSTSDEPSLILEKFGSGEVLKAGFLTVIRHGASSSTSSEEIGREWFVLKDRHLSYFHHGERVVALDFGEATRIVVRSPTIVRSYDDKRNSSSSLLNFGIEVETTSNARFVLKSDTPGEQEDWVGSIETSLSVIGKGDVISLAEDFDDDDDENAFREGDDNANPTTTTTTTTSSSPYVRFRPPEFAPRLPRLSEEQASESGGETSSVHAAVVVGSAGSGGSWSTSESVSARIRKQLSQRRGGGYAVRSSRFLKDGLDDEMGMYGETKTATKSVPPPLLEESVDDLLPPPPPPPDVVVETSVSDDGNDLPLPPPPDDLPPPPDDLLPPPDDSSMPPPPPPLVRRDVKPGRVDAKAANYMNTLPLATSTQAAGPVEDYLEMSDFTPDPSSSTLRNARRSGAGGGRGRKPDDEYVLMAGFSKPIDIRKAGPVNDSYVMMSSLEASSAQSLNPPPLPPPQQPFQQRVSPIAARRGTHSRQDSLDAGTPGVLLSTSPSAAWNYPSPNQSPQQVQRSRRIVAAGADLSSYGSTPSSLSTSSSTPHSADNNPIRSPKRVVGGGGGGGGDLFTAPRRTITQLSESPARDRELPATPGAGYYAKSFQRQVSEPASYVRSSGSTAAGLTRKLSPRVAGSADQIHRTASTASNEYRLRSDSSASVSSVASLQGGHPAQPLPAGWRSKYSDSGKMYYYHSEMQQRTWKIEDVWESAKGWEKERICLAPGWTPVFTSDGQTYYFNKETKKTSWNIQHTWKSSSTTLL